MTTVTVGGKATTRKSGRQRKPPERLEPGSDKAQHTDTKDQTVDKKSKTAKKKAPATKKATTTKKEPATKKAPATKRKSTANAASTAPETSTSKRTADPEDEPRTKKARQVESFATEEEAAILPTLRGKIERVRREKMYVMSRNPITETHEEFKVTGSTGNLYTITIGPKLSCSCPDFRYRRIHCKHILVVLLKMFHLPPNSPIFTTTRPNTSILREIFSKCTPDPTSLIPRELRRLIERKINGETDLPDIQTQRRPLDTSDCPICCGEFDENKIQDTLFCRVCGNSVHVECFNTWKNTKGSSVTCVYCRSPWEVPVKAAEELKVNHEGFVNFGHELGVPAERDTSTYRDFSAYR